MNTSTNLASVRLIVSDIRRVVGFYEAVLGAAADWGNDDFAELVTPRGTLAVGTTRTVPFFGAGSAEPSLNRTAIIEFLVDDVDAEWARLRPELDELGSAVVSEPTTMPWGNRALLFRDPEGTLVNLFTPVTDEARSKFSART
jgi:predicted enzyme related to lactoylglutathione lyase